MPLLLAAGAHCSNLKKTGQMPKKPGNSMVKQLSPPGIPSLGADMQRVLCGANLREAHAITVVHDFWIFPLTTLTCIDLRACLRPEFLRYLCIWTRSFASVKPSMPQKCRRKSSFHLLFFPSFSLSLSLSSTRSLPQPFPHSSIIISSPGKSCRQKPILAPRIRQT